MRITVLTQRGSRFGLKLLNLLAWEGVKVDQVVVFREVWPVRWRWLRRVVRRNGPLGVAALISDYIRSPFTFQSATWRGRRLEHDYQYLAGRVDLTASPQTAGTVVALRAGRPDLCLLAQSGLVPAEVLAVPRLATLNAHPGVLPRYRGMDSTRWALYQARPERVGSTLHLVDAGIDSGPILAVRPYRWVGDETLARIAWRINEDCIDLLAGAAREAWPEYAGRAVNQSGGKLFHTMSPKLWPEVQRKLARVRADRAARAARRRLIGSLMPIGRVCPALPKIEKAPRLGGRLITAMICFVSKDIVSAGYVGTDYGPPSEGSRLGGAGQVDSVGSSGRRGRRQVAKKFSSNLSIVPGPDRSLDGGGGPPGPVRPASQIRTRDQEETERS